MFRSIAPVWLVGFRPFFIATCVTGALFPMFWVSLYSGGIEPTAPLFNPYLSQLHWHMHEMFFGFGWALLGGFLLTASKNWLGIRGVHGLTLAGLVALWVLDRIAMAQGGSWSETTVYALSLPFITAIVLLLEVDLLSNHNLGKRVKGVSYDVFEELTIKTFCDLADEARTKWGSELNIFIEHYKGRLGIGGISIMIAVSSPHRDESFKACRFIIEEIKHRAPIWKQEHYIDGDSDWVQGHALCSHGPISEDLYEHVACGH